MSARAAIKDLQSRMSKDIVGQEHVLERIVIGLLANGNLLVEGLPGLAKTRAIKSLAKHLDAGLSRVQFTPAVDDRDPATALPRSAGTR